MLQRAQQRVVQALGACGGCFYQRHLKLFREKTRKHSALEGTHPMRLYAGDVLLGGWRPVVGDVSLRRLRGARGGCVRGIFWIEELDKRSREEVYALLNNVGDVSGFLFADFGRRHLLVLKKFTCCSVGVVACSANSDAVSNALVARAPHRLSSSSASFCPSKQVCMT
jgi:hypothetical protein